MGFPAEIRKKCQWQQKILFWRAVADPGFPKEGYFNYRERDANLLFDNFLPQVHENERNWTEKGGATETRPLESATEGNLQRKKNCRILDPPCLEWISFGSTCWSWNISKVEFVCVNFHFILYWSILNSDFTAYDGEVMTVWLVEWLFWRIPSVILPRPHRVHNCVQSEKSKVMLNQWWIQDLPHRGTNLKCGNANFPFWLFFLNTPWNWKKIWPRGSCIPNTPPWSRQCKSSPEDTRAVMIFYTLLYSWGIWRGGGQWTSLEFH